MASILNASLSSGLVATGDTSGIIQLQSNGTQTVNVATNGLITNTFNNAAGLVQGSQYYALNSTVAGANVTTAQSLLGVGVTLAASTIYEFEGMFLLLKTAGTTSHNFSQIFGGTCTANNFTAYCYPAPGGATNLAGLIIINSLNAFQAIVNSITNATEYIGLFCKGIISVNASGTFIPQYQLSAAPGGAYTTQIGSYFKIAPLGASGSNISIGSWA
jgi:hypothetical protein